MTPLDRWRAAMLTKGIPHASGHHNRSVRLRTRIRYLVRRLRYRLGCWVAGWDLEDI